MTQPTENGELRSAGGIPEQTVFRNVTVVLYSEREVICSKTLGDLRVNHGNLSVSISTDTIPEYVIFNSRNFWQERTQVEYYEKTDRQYAICYVTSKEELPVQINREESAGSCSTNHHRLNARV